MPGEMKAKVSRTESPRGFHLEAMSGLRGAPTAGRASLAHSPPPGVGSSDPAGSSRRQKYRTHANGRPFSLSTATDATHIGSHSRNQRPAHDHGIKQPTPGERHRGHAAQRSQTRPRLRGGGAVGGWYGRGMAAHCPVRIVCLVSVRGN